MIRVAIVGAGHWGPNLIRLFDDHPLSELRWVIERDDDRRARVEARFPAVRVAESIESAIDDDEVDAVVIATPSSTHFTLAKRALQSGKHVLIEKPITTSTRDGEELCALAADSNRVLMVGHVFLYNAAVQHAKAAMDAGQLGRVYYISMVRTNLGPIRMDVNAAWDLAAHDISIANYWLGSQPISVSATAGTWINPGVEDTVFATLRYPDNVLVNVNVSWLHPRKAREISVVGDRRMLTLDDLSLTGPIHIYDKQVTDERVQASFTDSFAAFRASVRDGDIAIPKVAFGEPLGTEIDDFLNCIEQGAVPLAEGSVGVAVVRALEAITKSIAEDGAHVPIEAIAVPTGVGAAE